MLGGAILSGYLSPSHAGPSLEISQCPMKRSMNNNGFTFHHVLQRDIKYLHVIVAPPWLDLNPIVRMQFIFKNKCFRRF